MKKILTIENPQENFDEIQKLISVVFEGFMATAMDYSYHINNTFGAAKDGKHLIYELRDNIHYRLRTSQLHLYLLLRQKIDIENRFGEMLQKNPNVFSGFIMGNPHFDRASDEMMGIYDSIIFNLSSSFDYLAMLLQFVFGQNPQKNLQWITLAKYCYSGENEFTKRIFKENIKRVDNEFVSKFNDYRAELIHRKKSTSFANVTWKVTSGEVRTQFVCSDKIKSNFKKLLDKESDYCITYVAHLLTKETVLKVGNILEGIHDEFRMNYNQHAPVMGKGGFQLISMNSETKFAEPTSLGFWKKFMEYKNFC